MLEEVVISPIAEEHIEGFWRCLDSVARERRYLLMMEAPPRARVQEFVRNNIRNGNVQLVALAGGEVVGWCDIVPRPHEGFQHCGVLGMGVLASHRGRGIGRRLATEALRRAWEKGLEKVELDVYASNKVARSLYKSLGFAVEGVRRRARKIDGAYDDIVQMALFREGGVATNSQGRPLITALDHIQVAMPAGGEEQARAFYHGILGLEEVEKPTKLKSRGGCWFHGRRTIVHIGVEEEFRAARKAHPAFTVSDLEGLRHALERAGYQVIPDDAVPGVERFYTFDPFGNRLEFIREGQGFLQRGQGYL